jgi:hypothetical protein
MHLMNCITFLKHTNSNMKIKVIPMPATVILQALQWNRARHQLRARTLEEMLRVKDLYIEFASFNN